MSDDSSENCGNIKLDCAVCSARKCLYLYDKLSSLAESHRITFMQQIGYNISSYLPNARFGIIIPDRFAVGMSVRDVTKRSVSRRRCGDGKKHQN